MKYKPVAQPHFPVATGIDHLPAKWFYRFAIWDLIREQRKVNIFIAHTNMEKQWLIKEGIEENRIHIVRYPCVPDSLFKYTPKIDIHEKLGSNSVITYISRIHPRKGQHILIETTKYLKDMLEDFKVYLAGPVSDYRYLLSIYKLVERYNVAREIVLEPRALNEVEKFDTMATSDIFACTPLKDNTPVVVLEALALGTIVMITNVGTMQEYKAFIPEGLYLTSMDPIDVANNIVKAMEEGRRCNTLRIAMKVFSCSNIVSQLEKLYKTLVQ
jgi:glycosyltransferase involved in cell wall biosynthesis